RHMLIFTAILALAACVISVMQTRRLRIRGLGTDDQGRMGDIKLENAAGIHIRLPDGLLWYGLYAIAVMLAFFKVADINVIFTVTLLLITIIVASIKFHIWPVKLKERRRHSVAWEDFKKALVKPGLGLLAAILVLVVNPVLDIYYYGAALVVMGLIGWNILDMIDRYNLLATRELPQFYKRGGEENVR
ncbi:MAG: hypothetical protein K2O57_06135, partial [Acetatifactor sp.]|nr:hypothetical protein [Acetatifactor sp.]